MSKKKTHHHSPAHQPSHSGGHKSNRVEKDAQGTKNFMIVLAVVTLLLVVLIYFLMVR